ncbi:MFS transporter [Sulfitobacter sabulilitoris]|uniref:MFS transporter n=1 Tax=Sulfitobacter sabulilitoris TaxID=2562655 RepID=A0A5S3PGJ6_9RHOB|nr:MFS transporter [Sulfitobacter sabulilitoris]TMM52421.1 MFS transporter [Sulfitobacter sabulilitoris]
MTSGLFVLGLAYVLSQFFRAFLAVLAPVLKTDLGADPDALALASGMWFLSFAAMQIPVGWALDTLGPRRTAAALLLVGGAGGASVFALATMPGHIAIAMALIGVGCSPVLMASYYIFARQFPARQFATLAALMVGLGSVGNLIASYPMALSADLLGWRASLFGLAGLSALTALGILVLVRDPPKPEGEAQGSLRELLRLPALWLILPLMFVNYAPAGALRGLWIGPYLADTFDLSTQQIGQATLAMGLAMILGTLAYGPLDRVFGSRKWVVVGGSVMTIACLGVLTLLPALGPVLSTGLLAGVGFFGAAYPMMVAHGRGFLPPHLVGRGVTLLNLFSIGGVGVMQFVSGRVHADVVAGGGAPYPVLFALFGGALLIGLVFYLFSRDSTA